MAEETCDGEILYAGDPYNVDADGYYCADCGLTGSDEPRFYGKTRFPHKKGVGGYERDVINAAIRLRQTSTHIDDREEYEANEEALLNAVDRLLEAKGETE
jgi:hypothetical protein